MQYVSKLNYDIMYKLLIIHKINEMSIGDTNEKFDANQITLDLPKCKLITVMNNET